MTLPDIHLCIVQPAGHEQALGLLDPARYFRYHFRRLGARVSLSKNRLRHDAVNFVFGAHLGFDHDYTVFGRVIDGMQWVDKIERGEPPARPTRIIHAYILADNPPPYQPAPVNVPALPAGETKAVLPQ